MCETVGQISGIVGQLSGTDKFNRFVEQIGLTMGHMSGSYEWTDGWDRLVGQMSGTDERVDEWDIWDRCVEQTSGTDE